MADCIFCQVIAGKLPGRFVYRDEEIVVFHDIYPKAPVHALVVPVKHIESVSHIGRGEKELFGSMAMVIQRMVKELGIEKSGYKLVVNNGAGAGQIIFHLHIHILGGWKEKQTW